VQTGFLLLLLGAALVPGRRARSVVSAAAIAAGLALAALRAAPMPLETGFASANAALAALAVVLGVAGAVAAVRQARTPEAVGGAIAAGAGALAAAWGGRSLAPAAAPVPFASALVSVLAAGTLLVLGGVRLRLPRPERAPGRLPPWSVGGLGLGVLAVAAAPHVAIVFLGVILGGWSGWRLRRAAGGSRWILAPLLTLVLLPAYRLMAVIAGPEGLRVSALHELPFSPAAEVALAPALLIAAWAVSGLWPLHRQVPGPLTAPIGVLLLVRIALSAVPDGLAHWRALVMPVIVVGLWHAALSGRWPLIAVALAWVGAIAPGRDGPAGAGLLLAGALLTALAARFGEARPGLTAAARIGAAVGVGWGGLRAIESALQGEVVYTVLATAGLLVAAGHWAGGQAITASAPSAAAPSA
jgi:hypothetical protein